MKLVIDGQTVEIKVMGYDGKYNKMDTMYFINSLVTAFNRESEVYDSLGLDAIAKVSKDCGSDCYNFLESKGFYND